MANKNFVVRKGLSVLDGAIEGSNGSASAPAFSFADDSNTGIYRVGADSLGFSTGGTHKFKITTTSAEFESSGGAKFQIKATDGNEAFLQFRNSSNAGMGFRHASSGNELGIQKIGEGNNVRAKFTTSGFTLNNTSNAAVFNVTTAGLVTTNGYTFPAAVTGANDRVLTAQTDGSTAWAAAASGGIASLVADTTPQLGGDLDINGHNIVTTSGNADIDLYTHGEGSVRINDSGTNGGSLRVGNVVVNTLPAVITARTTSDGSTRTALQLIAGLTSGTRDDGFGPRLEFRTGESEYAGYLSGEIYTSQKGTTNANFDIHLEAQGTGQVVINDEYKLPAAVTGTNDYVLTAQTNGSTAWAAVGGASVIGDLTDVSMDITNFVDSFLLQPDSDGSAPSTGTLSGASNNIGIGKDTFSALTSGNSNVVIGTNAGTGITSATGNTVLGMDAFKVASGSHWGIYIGYQAGKAVTTGSNNLFIGSKAGSSVTDAEYNLFIGRYAGQNNTSGQYNTVLGMDALTANTTGSRNIAIGKNAYNGADTENDNIGIGYDALGGAVAGGQYNIALGNYTLDALTSADRTTAIGHQAGTAITTGGNHVLIGHLAGSTLTTQSTSVMIGYRAGVSSAGYSQTIIGAQAGGNSTSYNTVIGFNAMSAGTGTGNTFVGWDAGQGVASNAADYNTGIGTGALDLLTTGGKNIAIGWDSGNNITSGANNVVIGAADVTATSNDQLSISSGDGSPVWITGDSNGNVKLPDGNLDMADNYITTSESNGYIKFKENGTAGVIFYDDDESEYLRIQSGGILQFGLDSAGAGSAAEHIMQFRDTGGTQRNFMSINNDDLYIHNRAANGKVIIQGNTSTAGGNDVTAATFEDDKVTFAVQPVLPSSGIKFSDGSQQTVAASGADGNRLPAIKTLLSSADDKLHLSQAGHMGQVASNFNQNKYPIFMPFYSGAGGTFTKASVTINTGVSGAHVGLCFWSEDSNGKPTTKIGSELSFNAESTGIVTLTSQSITLAADTRYWVSWRSHPDSTGNVNFSGYEVAMEPIVMGDQTLPFCNILWYSSTSAFGSTTSHSSFSSSYRQYWPKMWLEIA